MARCEQEGLPYLFRQHLTKRAKQLIERLLRDAQWSNVGPGWQGVEEATLCLSS